MVFRPACGPERPGEFTRFEQLINVEERVMPFTQALAAKLFLFFLEPQALFLDNVSRRPTRPASRGIPRAIGQEQ
jgi:hypothetical protein